MHCAHLRHPGCQFCASAAEKSITRKRKTNYHKTAPPFRERERRAGAARAAGGAGAGRARTCRIAVVTVPVIGSRQRAQRSAMVAAKHAYETCPLSTGGKTRRVRLVRGEGRDVFS